MDLITNISLDIKHAFKIRFNLIIIFFLWVSFPAGVLLSIMIYGTLQIEVKRVNGIQSMT